MAEQQKIEFVLQANINDLQDGLKQAKGDFESTAKAIKSSLDGLKKIKGPKEALVESQAAAQKLSKILDQIGKRKSGPTVLDTQKLNAAVLEYQAAIKEARKAMAPKAEKTFVDDNIVDLKAFNDLLAKTKAQTKEFKQDLAKKTVENKPLESKTFQESLTLEKQLRAEVVKTTNVKTGLAEAFYKQQSGIIKNLSLEEKQAYIDKNQDDKIYSQSVLFARKQIREEIAKTAKQQTVGMIAQRYALYDVANSLNQASRQLTGFTKTAFLAQMEQERAFSQVEKTLVDTAEVAPEAIRKLKKELIDLTTVIPKSFDEISKVAAIGSQMGIATDSLAKFTEVVSKFTATTGVSVEAASLAFGRMANLLPDIDASKFDQLGSSIAFVGVKSVATEAEIISISRQISAISASAGFTAAQVVGLSSALASLGGAPEESRGVLVRTFGQIRKAVSGGGQALEQFGAISGMTGEEFRESWGANAGATFQRFIAGLGKVDTVKALQNVGLESIRTTKILTALGDNFELVFKQMQLAEEGMNNSYLEKTFATTVDDIIVRIELLNQAVTNLFAGATSSPAVLGTIGFIADSLKSLVILLKDINDNPVSSFISTLTISFVGLIGVMLGVVGAAALFKASFLAIKTSVIGLVGAADTAAWIKAFLSGLFNIQGGAFVASKALIALKGAAMGLKLALPVLGLISIAAAGIFHVMKEGERQLEATTKAFRGFDGLAEALYQDSIAVTVSARAQKIYRKDLGDTLKEQSKAKDEAKNLATVLGKDLVEGAEAGAKAVGVTAAIYGNATADFFKARMVSSEDFQAIFKREDFAAYWQTIGADIDVFVQEIIPQGREGVQKYFDELALEAQKAGKEIPPLKTLDFLDAAYSGISGTAGKTALDEFINLTGGVDSALQGFVRTNEIVGLTAEQTANKIRMLTNELVELALESVGFTEGGLKVEESLYGLGEALTKNGDNFSEFSKEGRDNINAVNSVVAGFAKEAQGDMAIFGASINGLINQLVAEGYEGTAVVGLLRDSISNLVDDAGKPIKFDVNFEVNIESFREGLAAALEGTKKATGKVETALEKMVKSIEGAFKKLNSAIDANNALESLGESLIENGKNFSVFSKQGRDNLGAVQDAIDSLAQKSEGNTRQFGKDLDALRRVLQRSGFSGSAAIKLINQAMRETGSRAKATAKEVKNMAKSINGLRADRLLAIARAADSVASRLNDLFGASLQGEKANLALAAGYDELAEKVAEAREEIEETQRTIQGLVADKGILEYQLQIALKYGDTLRAEEIRAQLDSINASITENQAAITKAEASLTGGSAAAQLETLVNLEDQANKINTAFANLAAQGDKTRKELREWVDAQTELFYESSIAAGMSEEDARRLADEIKKNLYDAIKKTPKIKVNTDGANKSVNALKANINSLRDKTVTITTVNKTINQASLTGGSNPGMSMPRTGWQKFYSTGGFVSGPGSSTSDSIAARLSNGEYVIRASAVKHYGVDFMNSLNSQTLQQRPMAVSGSQSSVGEQLVYLSPEDRNLLRQAIDRPINLYTENTKIAQSVNAGNVILAQRGQA